MKHAHQPTSRTEDLIHRQSTGPDAPKSMFKKKPGADISNQNHHQGQLRHQKTSSKKNKPDSKSCQVCYRILSPSKSTMIQQKTTIFSSTLELVIYRLRLKGLPFNLYSRK